jgi:hypothetical protein
MKYYITTLAINEPYFSNSLKFHISLSEKTEYAMFNITTTKNDIERFEQENKISLDEYLYDYPKLKVTTIEDFNFKIQFPLKKEDPADFPFNVNLKALALKACVISKKSFDYIFFIDADWGIHTHFAEQKILNAIHRMKEQDVDFAYERPAQIGPHKTNTECFFPQKIRDYNVLEHSVWDSAYVVNEQILLFVNNWKFRLFCMKWEQFLWYSIANNICNYAEGFEIGVAALESQMKWSYYGVFNELSECFNFYSRDGRFNIRF